MELSWKEACIKVLSESDGAMHYTDISEKILKEKYRKNVGATPASSCNVVMSASIRDDGDKSQFIRTGKGFFSLNPMVVKGTKKTNKSKKNGEAEDSDILIQASGLFWQRDFVQWKTYPKLLGKQFSGSDMIDFAKQNGIYILYDNHTPIYVGRADVHMGKRVSDHTRDKFSGRWNRFSWFGLLEVCDSGVLSESKKNNYTQEKFISTVEAILIETLEPPRNMRIGDYFRACEYLQVKDPALEKTTHAKIFKEWFEKMSKEEQPSDE